MVGIKRIELLWISPLEPKSSASTSSAIPPSLINRIIAWIIRCVFQIRLCPASTQRQQTKNYDQFFHCYDYNQIAVNCQFFQCFLLNLLILVLTICCFVLYIRWLKRVLYGKKCICSDIFVSHPKWYFGGQ